MISRLLAVVLFALLPLSAALAQTAADDLVEGRDYVVIADARPWQPQAGRIEVAEVFAYPCSHCADFQPLVDAWLRKAPTDVVFAYVPAAFDPADAYARGYFAAQALGVDKRLHQRFFDAVHRDYSLPARGASLDEVAQFAAANGVDRAKFRAAMTSADTEAKMVAAREFAVRSGLRGTPTVIVDGRYRVQGRTLADTLRITDRLIERARADAR